MKLMGKIIGTFVLAIGLHTAASAQEVKFGGHVGALGIGSSTGIGFGASLQIAPYETVGVRIDGTLAQIDGSSYFSTNPMIVWFVPTTEEFKAGVMFGGGFHKIGNLDMKFGIGGGASADFMLSKALSVGGIIQTHNVFDYDSNVWSVMLTLSSTFGGAASDW